MQFEKTKAGFAASDLLVGAPIGLIFGILVGLKTNLILGLIAGTTAGILITLFHLSHGQTRKGRDESDGAAASGGDGDWAHIASQRCYDSAHSSDSGWDGGGDSGDGGGGDGGGGGD